MQVHPANLREIYRNLNAAFQREFQAAPNRWQQVATRIPSAAALNTYAWIGYFPKMREWLGEKAIRQLEGRKYEIVNKDWEATVAVRRNHIEDDQLGIYAPQAQMAGYAAAQLPDELVFGLLAHGFEGLCYDGQPFFDAAHPVGAKTVSNKGTKRLDISSYAKAKSGYGAARTALLEMKDEEGRPLGVRPNVLAVPPALEAEARILTEADHFKGDDPNPYRGTATVVVDERLTASAAWFLLDASKPLKPLIYQERKAPEFKAQDELQGAASDAVFNRGEFRYSVECRGNAGYAFWQLAYGSTGKDAA